VGPVLNTISVSCTTRKTYHHLRISTEPNITNLIVVSLG